MKRKAIIGAVVLLAVAGTALAVTLVQPFITPGPRVIADGNEESFAALAEIKESLRRHGCQLGVTLRINGEGQTEPRIVVESTMIHPNPYE